MNILFCLFISSIAISYSCKKELNLGAFEGSVISLWESHTNAIDQRMTSLKYVELKNQARLLQLYADHDCQCASAPIRNIVALTEVIHNELSQIDNCLIGELCLDLLHESFSLRQCYDEIDNPLAQLIQAYESNLEIAHVVNDQMMDLKYWFEFMDLVEVFISSWDKYQCYTISRIELYYPAIDIQSHHEYMGKVADCTDLFLDSMQSGNRTEMISPCDDLRSNLEQLIFSYRFVPDII